MRLLPSWLREFVTIPADDTKLADDLTMAGISIEGVMNEGGKSSMTSTSRPTALTP